MTEEREVLYTNDVEVAEVLKAPSSKLVVSIVVHDGVKYLHIHEWYKKKTDEEWKPGLKSVSVPVKYPDVEGLPQDVLQKFVDAINKTISVADTIPLDDPNNYVYKMTREERRRKAEETRRIKEARAEAVIAKDVKRLRLIQENYFRFVAAERERLKEVREIDVSTVKSLKKKFSIRAKLDNSTTAILKLRKRILGLGCLEGVCYECGKALPENPVDENYCSEDCAKFNRG